MDIFQTNDSIFALDDNGNIYSLRTTTINPANLMEVEDLFSSPVISETLEWTEKIITKVNECDKVEAVCHLTASLALLTVKGGLWNVCVYSLPEYNSNCVLNLNKFNSKASVLSSCVISLMTPKLKQNFKEHLEPFDEEIIVIGLKSGLLIWFCVKSPVKGPFVMFNTYQDIQNMHWIKDPNSGLYVCLLVLLSSGQAIAFGGEKHSMLCLPDSVESSSSLKNSIISSNFVDCYASELQMGENVSANSVLLPVKGVCTMTSDPDSDVIIAVTNHGSVYSFDPTVKPPEKSTFFTLPDQSLLDNMFMQSQILDNLNKQLDNEGNILKAVSATIAANSCQNLFELSVKVNSDLDFTVRAKLVKSKVVFQSNLWSVCVETIRDRGRKTLFDNMEHNLSINSDLVVNVNCSLEVEDVVSVELVYFIDKKLPILIVPVGKVTIDACHLMCSQLMIQSTAKTKETLSNILADENKMPQQTLRDCKLTVKVPDSYLLNTFFKTILSQSQHRFMAEEWDKISNGKKFNVSACICGVPVLLKLEVESRELIISSSCTKLCHQIKKAVIARFKTEVNNHIPESLTLDLQALFQTFEIESLKENPNIEALDSLRKNVRASTSALFSA
ncbi:uncharacterized protein LOC128989426 [Macrosteles quadrilineatus]|uniref:uncharacterized protein LOC128989426 n=1 Tax=Macrosteles quadrilineatus TaxID=74068 RepID=UPI0023E25270|nr:uncharacterized protein LOC128989426 [Macrosteles quadrilineatus]